MTSPLLTRCSLLALLGALALTAAACQEATTPDDADAVGDAEDACYTCNADKADSLQIKEGSYLARGILWVANTASLEELDIDAGLNKRAAGNIVEVRTNQGSFGTLVQLDDVSYVGPAAINALATYAQESGRVPYCGDGLTQGGLEVCDDGNTEDGDGCDATCQVSDKPDGPPYSNNTRTIHGYLDGGYEGRAILDTANVLTKEELDAQVGLDRRAAQGISDAQRIRSLTALDAIPWVGKSAFDKLLTHARATNRVPSCGDGRMLALMERCDDGNLEDGDGCSSSCTLENVCGDGVVEFQETCDFGDANDGDGCSAECTWEARGEGGRSSILDDNNREFQATPVGFYRMLQGSLYNSHYQRDDVDYWMFEIDRTRTVSIDVWSGVRSNTCKWIYYRSPSNTTHQEIFAPKIYLKGNGIYEEISSDCGKARQGEDDWDFVTTLAPGKYYIQLRAQNAGAGWSTGYSVGYGIELERL